jgi:hypothetical protein
MVDFITGYAVLGFALSMVLFFWGQGWHLIYEFIDHVITIYTEYRKKYGRSGY